MGSVSRRSLSELPAPRLTCVEVVDLLADYLEDALSDGDRRRVEAHLDACPNCTTYVEQLRTTIAVIGRLRAEDEAQP